MLNHFKSLFLQRCNKYRLDKKTTIRQLFSMFMLLLFAFSITPKKTLHTIFGCHSNTTAKSITHNETEQLATKSFHCGCDHQDLQTPFLHSPTFFSTIAFKYGAPLISRYKTAVYRQSILSADLRGPPSVI